MDITSIERLAEVGDSAFDRFTLTMPTYEEPWKVGVIRCLPAAVVLPYDLDRGYFVLAGQPRVGALGALVIEAPAGRLDQPGEDAEATARRELREELGLIAAHWTTVATETFVSPANSDEQMSLFLAGGLTEVPAREEDAHIARVTVPLTQLDAQIARYKRLAAPDEPKKDLKTLALLYALKLELLSTVVESK